VALTGAQLARTGSRRVGIESAAVLDIDASVYPNITELREVSSHAVEASAGGRRFRVTAQRDIGRPEPYYWAEYEEEVSFSASDVDDMRTVWVGGLGIDIPWQDGDTIQECLRTALMWVNDVRWSPVT